jgi:hypothetical protein
MTYAPFIERRAGLDVRVQGGRVAAAKTGPQRVDAEIRVEIGGVVGRSRLFAKLPGDRLAQSGACADVQRKRTPGGVAARE